MSSLRDGWSVLRRDDKFCRRTSYGGMTLSIKSDEVKIWYWTTKRSVFELNGRLFDGCNALRRDDEFWRRNNGGWVVEGSWEDDMRIS